MRVIVTGGAGFIGSHIVEALRAQEYDVVVIDNLRTGQKYQPPAGVSFYEEDIGSHRLDWIFREERPDCVIHQAAQTQVGRSVEDPMEDAMVNVMGTIHLLECCRKYRTRKIVFASSAAVYGDPEDLPIKEEHPIRPQSPYAVSKYAVELYLRVYKELYGLDYTVLRYSNVYGPSSGAPSEGVVAAMVRRIRAQQPIHLYGDGSQTRDFVYVSDVAEANVLALRAGSGEVINISSGTQTTVKGLGEIIAKLSKTQLKIEYFPARAGDIQHSLLANEKAEACLGWRPRTPLHEGLKRSLKLA